MCAAVKISWEPKYEEVILSLDSLTPEEELHAICFDRFTYVVFTVMIF